MKIKTWLLLSYFVVMLLPLAAAYLLFAWINIYHNDRNVEEYVQKSLQLNRIVSVLDNPALYQPNIERPQIEKLVSPQVSIVLFNRDGLVLYTSNPLQVPPHFALGRKQLYENLYTLEQGFRAYRYKQPVFNGNELAGFFELQLSRDEWAAGVGKRTRWVAFVFAGGFVLIYLTVVWFVNRKLNRRLNRLMEQMTAFARREPFEEMPSGNDEIGELTKHFYGMRRQIEEAHEKIARQQQEKELLIASISHDLKTPLTSIRAYAESLALPNELKAEDREEYSRIIAEKADYMKQMLDDLTVYTLLQSPAYEMELAEVDGDEFFEMLLSGYEPICREKNIRLRVHCDVTGTVRVNPRQMMRVADNLMSNAVRHTKPGANILLAAVSSGRPLPEGLFSFVTNQAELHKEDGVYLIVQNEGEGMDEEQLSRVFEPLYQADEARSKNGERGTGLGLSITRQIIRKHGGTVHIFAQKGDGTCVVCFLPKTTREGEQR
ncbi:signal transduction histidine kinase [Thermobacillus composti KWC4]|uniref:histidine kinase n=1 Tax=Thermobacillus composti (strain DSM 18247 / JCM 13945 / KWC4) TaxID=717605 RepID=L0ECK6_THECK|nr:ATP-binding protein [Thermobacillus composti]AGA56885.1 signal transduction histidine kinase [Thermobacillus composti KWC4]